MMKIFLILSLVLCVRCNFIETKINSKPVVNDIIKLDLYNIKGLEFKSKKKQFNICFRNEGHLLYLLYQDTIYKINSLEEKVLSFKSLASILGDKYIEMHKTIVLNEINISLIAFDYIQEERSRLFLYSLDSNLNVIDSSQIVMNRNYSIERAYFADSYFVRKDSNVYYIDNLLQRDVIIEEGKISYSKNNFGDPFLFDLKSKNQIGVRQFNNKSGYYLYIGIPIDTLISTQNDVKIRKYLYPLSGILICNKLFFYDFKYFDLITKTWNVVFENKVVSYPSIDGKAIYWIDGSIVYFKHIG